MDKRQMERGLGQYLSFLERRIKEVQVIDLPPPPEGKSYPLEYHQNLAREEAFRRAEEELRRAFPEIDFYGRSFASKVTEKYRLPDQ